MAILGIFLFIVILLNIILHTDYNKKPKKKKIVEDILSKRKSDMSNINIMNIPQNKEDFIKAFTLDKPLYYQVPEHIKRQTISNIADNINGLSDEDKSFIGNFIYEDICVGNSKYTFKQVRDFIKQKLNLKYKYIAGNILEHQIDKAHCKLHRIELLQLNITKVKWVYLGGTCTKHKNYNNVVFDLSTGLYDEKLKKHIFPTDLENCDCSFIPIIKIN